MAQSVMDCEVDDSLDITGDQRTIKSFYKLLSDLSKELLSCELQQALLLCGAQGIPSETLKTNDTVELLRVLDELGIIGEDNTKFLKEILEAAGCVNGKQAVEEYEQERRQYLKNVEIILGKKDPFFVGRTNFVSKILQVFDDSSHLKCRCVMVHGLAGTGKTKLAGESCAIYKMRKGSSGSTRLLRVNLRKATSVEEVGLWILNTVTGKQITLNQFNMSLVKLWIADCTQDTILLLDNADDILKPSSYCRDYFINTMADLLTIQNKLVKFLLTSRHPIDFTHLKALPNFSEIKLEPLQVHESLYLLTKMVNQARNMPSGMATVGGEALKDEASLVKIAKLCGNNPQALRAVASRLSTGFSPARLVNDLERPDLIQRVLDPGSLAGSAAVQDEIKDFEDQPLVLSSLGAMYEQLSMELKEALLRLSVFPSSFSLSQGSTILGKASPDEAKYDLEDLKQWSLLERDVFDILDTGLSEEEPFYYIHPLVRSVALSKMSSSDIYQVAYREALRLFLGYIADMLKKLTQLGHRDFSQALITLDLNKTNVLHFLELDMGAKFGCKVIAEKVNKVNGVPLPENREGLHSMFETFLNPTKRLEYFKNKSREMLSKGEIEGWAYLQGWAADEFHFMAQYDKADEAIDESLKVLEERRSQTETVSRDSERAVAQLLYVKGRVLNGRNKFKESIRVLKKSLEMQQRLLGVHSVTARCLNAIGYAYSSMVNADPQYTMGTEEAHDYHKQAWDMLAKITNNHPEKHFDAPMYLLNIGASYHQMGQKCKRTDKKKANGYFRLAIRNYQEAHQLERDLKLANSPNATFLMKNMAMSYCEMEDYDKALPLAIDASDIRVKTFGVHPITARSLYFAGSLYQSLGDEHKKKDKPVSMKNYNLAMEYFNKAFQMEVKLGSSRRSIEYHVLKEDIEIVLKALNEDRELDRYRRLFKEADKGDTASGESSSNRKRSQESMEGDDDWPADENEDEAAGPSTWRQAPGPVFDDDIPGKRSKCNLS